MKEEILSYSEVPFGFGMCGAEDCSCAVSCLRQLAYKCVPAQIAFPPTLNPKTIKDMTGKCKYCCTNEKLRFARGFICTAESIPVRAAGKFRSRLAASWGIRKYYQKRKGETLLSPTEQQQVISLAKELGVHQSEYFDGYVEEYNWG